jgi:SRSO17 transposase
LSSHLYDGKKSLPLDIELYQHSSSLPEGKKDENFKKKPELGIELIERSLARGYRPGLVLIDAGYGNNTTFLQDLEEKKLKYLGGLAKNRKVMIKDFSGIESESRLDEYAKSLSSKDFEKVVLNLDKPKKKYSIGKLRDG